MTLLTRFTKFAIIILGLLFQLAYAGENVMLEKKLTVQENSLNLSLFLPACIKRTLLYTTSKAFELKNFCTQFHKEKLNHDSHELISDDAKNFESLSARFKSYFPVEVTPFRDTKKSIPSLASVLKILPQELYKGIRYAVSHPRQLLVLGLAAHIIPIVAQLENEFLVNQNTTSAQAFPLVKPLTNGNVFVVWLGSQAGATDIYGRIFFPNGLAAGNEFLINENSTTSIGVWPTVIDLINGNVFVAWNGYQAGNYDLYGRFFFPDGTALENEFQINQNGIEGSPLSGVSLTNGNVFVVWGDIWNINGRIFLPNGIALDDGFLISQGIATDGSPSSYPIVLALPDGNAFVAWASTLYNSNILGRVFFSNGTALGDVFFINQNRTLNQDSPSVEALTNGDVFVTWRGNQGGTYDIYGRIFLPDGTALGNEFLINQNSTYSQNELLETGTNGNVFVAWQGKPKTGSYNDIFMKIFLSNGTALENQFIINQNTTNNVNASSLSANLISVNALTNGTVLVVWQNRFKPSNQVDFNSLIYAKVFLPNGTSESNEFIINQITTNPLWPSVEVLNNGDVFIAWYAQNNNNDVNIYARILFFTDVIISNQSSSSVTSIASSFSSGTNNWQTPTAIVGALGGTALIGVSALLAKKYCSKRKSASDYTDSELSIEDGSSQVIDDSQADSSLSHSFLEPTPVGFIKHPTIVGKFHGQIYEIWKKLSPKEAERLSPLTSITLPTVITKKLKFTLGQGQFGVTYAGQNTQTSEIVAIKEVYGKSAVDESLREGKIVHSLGEYAHIMPLIDYINFESNDMDEEPRLLQVMPLAYINGAGLIDMLYHSPYEFREKIIADGFYQMMLGLDFLHTQGVVHLDIKADNTLYMRNGTLRIADFGRAQVVGTNDLIDTVDSLGDVRKFSPEIVAFLRHYMGIPHETVESFSGKAADIWAAGLFIWELLVDEANDLFSTKSIPLPERVSTYTYESFERLLEALSDLKGTYSEKLLASLHQVLTVNPESRIKTRQALKELIFVAMNDSQRSAAFEEAISNASAAHASAEEQPYSSVYPFADPKMYINRSASRENRVYLPSELYPSTLAEKSTTSSYYSSDSDPYSKSSSLEEDQF